MITPRDIETREFSRSRAGYKTDEVEAFLDEVLADYTKLLEERDSYAKRVLALSEKLESIREQQQNELKQMLEANFKSRDDIITEAKMQAAKIIGSAKNEKENAIVIIENELNAAKEELERVKLNKNAIIKEVEDFKAVLIDINDEVGPYGAKSISEIATNGAAPAIAIAIHDAVGVWMRNWPFTPEKILKEMGRI